VNRNEVEKRRQALLAQRAELLAKIKRLQEEVQQLVANVSAFNGAIEDCEYWLSEMKPHVEEEIDG
jgi:uncharacterized protein YoxC